MTCDLTDKIFTDEDAARAHFEKLRWPDGPVCPHCGTVNEATELKGNSTRAGLYKCRPCQKPFTATMGTLYERSHIPLNKWLLATHLMTASKKGMSAHQLWRMLGFGSYRTAWFMAHRIREGMRELFPEESGPLGGEGKTVEMDETFVGGLEKNKHRSKRKHKGTGRRWQTGSLLACGTQGPCSLPSYSKGHFKNLGPNPCGPARRSDHGLHRRRGNIEKPWASL